MKKPLTIEVLSDPENKLVKTIMYIYSMQSFVFTEVNKASRNKDVTKIKFYGPFAVALSCIIHAANIKKKEKLPKKFTTYRGLKLTEEEIDKEYTEGESINLLGFTSTSTDRTEAVSFALGFNNS